MPGLARIRCIDPRGLPRRGERTAAFPDGKVIETPLMYDNRTYSFAPAGSGKVTLPSGKVISDEYFIDADIAHWLASRPQANPVDEAGSSTPRLEVVEAHQSVETAIIDGQVFLIDSSTRQGHRAAHIDPAKVLLPSPKGPQPQVIDDGAGKLLVEPTPPGGGLEARLASLNDPDRPADARVG